MQKYRSTDVKSFQFSDLQGTHVVEQSKFENFQFGDLTGESVSREKVSDDQIRAERKFAAQNNFKIDDIVCDSRGISQQEENDFEYRIEIEVKKRTDAAYQNAYQEGLNRGIAEGKEQGLKELHEVMGIKIEEFAQVITEVQNQSQTILDKSQTEVYDFIKRFTKWIVLKEIDEKKYLESLLEKLILELNARKNLIVKVGRNNFQQMPEIIQVVESRLGQLSNLRIEIVPELSHPGIILESENGLIDGSLEGVFKNIDKIFEQVLPDQVKGYE